MKGKLKGLTADHNQNRATQEQLSRMRSGTRNEFLTRMDDDIEETSSIYLCLFKEYGCLCVTLRDYEGCRKALMDFRKEMSAAALHEKLSRYFFWVDVMENVFTGKGHEPILPELTGVLSNLFPERLPPCFQSDKNRRIYFCKLRPDFSELLDRWQRFGQGNPGRFT